MVSCQPDLVEDVPIPQDQAKMKLTHTSLSSLSHSSPEIFERSSSLAFSSSYASRGVESGLELILDTTNVLITEGTNYKNYIFRVLPEDDDEPDELKNLMLVRLRDSLTHQYLVTYKMLDSVTIDTTNVRIEGFFSQDLRNLLQMRCKGGGGTF